MIGPDPRADTGAHHARAENTTAEDTAMTLSKEVLNLSTEWTESGRIRLRRRIVTETRTVQVILRREELEIEVRDIDQHGGVLAGTKKDGPVTDPPRQRPPLVIALQEEVPDIGVRLQPYEMITVTLGLTARTGRVAADLRHEELQLDAAPPASTSRHGRTP